jgi:hypothetical protein
MKNFRNATKDDQQQNRSTQARRNNGAEGAGEICSV